MGCGQRQASQVNERALKSLPPPRWWWWRCCCCCCHEAAATTRARTISRQPVHCAPFVSSFARSLARSRLECARLSQPRLEYEFTGHLQESRVAREFNLTFRFCATSTSAGRLTCRRGQERRTKSGATESAVAYKSRLQGEISFHCIGQESGRA